MRGRVHVLPPAQYERWKRERALPPELVANAPLSGRAEVEPTKERANLAALGLRVAGERGCLRCHTLDGTPHLGPSWARLYNAEIPLEGGGKVRADDAYLTRSMMEPVAEVHQGFERIMPSYMGMLTPAEIGALVALIHSLENRIPDEVLAPLPVPQPVRLKEGAPDSVQPSLNAPLETSP
jgi:cytochrome c oxidase subunit 2